MQMKADAAALESNCQLQLTLIISSAGMLMKMQMHASQDLLACQAIQVPYGNRLSAYGVACSQDDGLP